MSGHKGNEAWRKLLCKFALYGLFCVPFTVVLLMGISLVFWVMEKNKSVFPSPFDYNEAATAATGVITADLGILATLLVAHYQDMIQKSLKSKQEDDKRRDIRRHEMEMITERLLKYDHAGALHIECYNFNLKRCRASYVQMIEGSDSFYLLRIGGTSIFHGQIYPYFFSTGGKSLKDSIFIKILSDGKKLLLVGDPKLSAQEICIWLHDTADTRRFFYEPAKINGVGLKWDMSIEFIGVDTMYKTELEELDEQTPLPLHYKLQFKIKPGTALGYDEAGHFLVDMEEVKIDWINDQEKHYGDR